MAYSYEDLSLSLFISGYVAIVDIVKPTQTEAMLKHLRELMADVEICWCEPVRAFHGVWVPQLENGSGDWGDEEMKVELRTSYGAQFTEATLASLSPWRPLGKRQARRLATSWCPAKPGTEACTAYNLGKCMSQDDHPRGLHICAY